MTWKEKYNIIYFNLFSAYYDKLPPDLRNKYIAVGFWTKIGRVSKTILYDLKNSFRKKSPFKTASEKKWIIVDAVNNLQSVNDIFEGRLNDVTFFTYSTRFSKINQNVILIDFSGHIAHVWRMILYILSNSATVKDRWDLFLTETGWYESARRFLKKHKPASILFTNDHTPVNRAMMLAARSLGIKTGYIQHACVRDDFGALLVDFAFLDGQDSADKYNVYGNRFQTQIQLIGTPKLSKYLHMRSAAKKIEVIGIAFNITDDLTAIASLVKELQQASFRVVVRPHPKDNRVFPPMDNVTLDDPVKNNAFDFLNSIDGLIAGESAIHAESILLNKPSFQYNFNPSSAIHDLYGFLRNDLVQEFKEPQELVKHIERYNAGPVDVYKKGVYYSAMVDDPREAESATLAFDRIEHSLFNVR